MTRERLVAEYLDKKLYSQNSFTDVFRHNDSESQRRGEDIRVSMPKYNFYSIIDDEKAQLYCLDGGLPTFAFELNFLLASGKRFEGWLTDESKTTQYYNLLFLTALPGFTPPSQITRIEYILIKRATVLGVASGYGLDVAGLRAKGLQVAKSPEFRQYPTRGCPFYFTHSTKLAESPVNIIMRKRLLLQDCVSKGIV